MTPIYMTFWKIQKYWYSKMVFSRGERVWMGLRWGLKETTYWWKYVKDTQETTEWALYGQSCESSSNRIIWDFNPKYKISIGLYENERKEGRKGGGRKKGKRKEKERNIKIPILLPPATHRNTYKPQRTVSLSRKPTERWKVNNSENRYQKRRVLRILIC